jgi:tRNA threonylcarbamoyl adenosine modification protein (Sua5/YciO/YrdC/YwlC family)
MFEKRRLLVVRLGTSGYHSLVMSTRVITVGSRDDVESVQAAAAEGAEALRVGKLVGFATETVYGIAVLATDAAAVARLRKLKARPTDPFSVHIASPADVRRYVADVPLRASWLMSHAWPGPVTLLLDTGGRLADPALQKRRGLHKELTLDGVVGLRSPDEPVARAMLAAVDGPVVAPSANPAGGPSPRTGDDVMNALGGLIDMLIDSGPTRYGKDSTIVRMDGNDWQILRQGVYDERMIGRMVERKICFVCTGNTCRSPMAAGIARAKLAEALDCDAEKLKSGGVEVVSAGLFAGAAALATPEAVSAAAKFGAEISDHRSRQATPELLKSCDVVFCMTEFHQAEIQRLLPEAAGRVKLLDVTAEVPDPVGGGSDIYDRTAGHIAEAIDKRIAEGTL